MKKVSSKFSASNFCTFLRGTGCGLQAMGHGLLGLGCGNLATIAMRYVADAHCPKEPPYQIWTQYNLRQRS